MTRRWTQGQDSPRNDARSGAERVPLMLLFVDGDETIGIQFDVSKADLEIGLMIVSSMPTPESRNDELKALFARLIRASEM